MSNLLGELFPNFVASTTLGPIQFYDWVENSWSLFVSYHSDFTSVSLSEIAGLIVLHPELQRRNVKVICCSCNSLDTHNQWMADVKSYAKYNYISNSLFPIIADDKRDLAIELDIIDVCSSDAYGIPFTLNATFLIDPNKKVQFSSVSPKKIGRNFDELLQMIDKLQSVEKNKDIGFPTNWKPEEKVFVLTQMPEEKLRRKYPNLTVLGLPSERQYAKQIPQPFY